MTSVPYDEFIFTNAIGELENRENANDAGAPEIVAHTMNYVTKSYQIKPLIAYNDVLF
jgi:hypothetical protein